MSLGTKRLTPALQLLLYIALAIVFVLSIVLRLSLYHIETSDYSVFVSQWYDFIQTHGGFAAMKYNFSNYNPPYLYLLALLTYMPIPKLIAVKTLSIAFDLVLGLFTYLILRLRYQRVWAAIAGSLVVLWAPTIFINSSAWGQCDAIYAAFCLGSLYFLLKERPAWACVFFGLAISCKLQAIFFLPVLLIMLLKRKLPVQYLAIIPLVFLLLLSPALIAGRDIGSLLNIYPAQMTSGGAGQVTGGGGGQFNGGGAGQFTGANPGGPFGGGTPGQFAGGNGRGSFRGGGFGVTSSTLTLNAPTLYQWFPADAASSWKWLGIGLAALFVLMVCGLFMRSKQPLTAALILKVALVFAIAIPFFLPEMHERYFYLADVLSIVYAFYFPRRCYVAIIIQLSSLLSYTPYLLRTQVVSLSYVAVAVLIAVIVTTTDLVLTLYPTRTKSQGHAVITNIL